MYNPYFGQYAPPVPDILGQMKANYRTGEPLFVLGETEAISYPVAPNTTVILWDRDKDTLYVKSVNAQGVPMMRVLDYVERRQSSTEVKEHECKCGKDFVRKEEFEQICAKLEALEASLKKEVEE